MLTTAVTEITNKLTTTTTTSISRETYRLVLNDTFAAIVPRITGGISALSSSLLIYIILRSEKKLSTIYHRLMFAISCADILGSVAMGLTTWPMPKDEIFDPSFFWEGTRLGNIQTCEAQGFFFVFGTFTMFAYNGMLCVYYTCAIAFKMEEQKIKKRVEPWLHIIPLAFALSYAVPPFFTKMYNATIHEAWCTIIHSNELERGNSDSKFTIMLTSLIIISVMFTIVVVSFTLIICRVYHTEKILNSASTRILGRTINRQSQLRPAERVEQSHQNTKVVIIQAFAYIGSYLFTLAFPFLRSFSGVVAYRTVLIARLSIIFMPLQGFFNALIFIYHKIYNYRRLNEDVSKWDTLKMLLRGSLDEPILFSRISQMDIHEGHGSVDVELTNEENVEHLTLHINLNNNSSHDVEQFSDDNNNNNNPPENDGSQDLSGFASTRNKHQQSASITSNSRVSFHQSVFSHGNAVLNDNTNDSNNNTSSARSSCANFEGSSTISSRAGLSGFSTSQGNKTNDNDLSYEYGCDSMT